MECVPDLPGEGEVEVISDSCYCFLDGEVLWLQGAVWLISLRVVCSVTWATVGTSADSRHKSKGLHSRLSFHNSEVKRAEREGTWNCIETKLRA